MKTKTADGIRVYCSHDPMVVAMGCVMRVRLLLVMGMTFQKAWCEVK
jgi:hypothetical protein